MVVIEERYVGNYLDYRRDLDAGRCNAHMASQPRVGLLPKRRTGNCPGHSDHLAATGSALGGRALLVSRTENRSRRS